MSVTLPSPGPGVVRMCLRAKNAARRGAQCAPAATARKGCDARCTTNSTRRPPPTRAASAHLYIWGGDTVVIR